MNTQEQKEFLLKDLCARLPYGVKVNENIQGVFTLIGLTTERVFTTCEVESCHNDFPIENIKPYLFPLSSMTVEQKQYLKNRFCYDWNGEPYDLWICQIEIGNVDELIDWFHKNHIDYRNLIDENLAIDATGLNIY